MLNQFRQRLLVVGLTLACAFSLLALTTYAEVPSRDKPDPTRAYASLAEQVAAEGYPFVAALGGGVPAATVIENFPNSWHGSTIGLVYNPLSDTVRYVHEDSATNPTTIWDIDPAPPHATQGSVNLATVNAGWPTTLNDRDGADYDPNTGTYFLTDFQGDLTARDDNIIEITPGGTIVNAWETDGASNDSSDATIINTIIDIAIVPGTPNRYFVAAAGDAAGFVREIALTRAGIFTAASWNTVGTCTVPGMADNVGIDYDADNGVLYHSSFSDELIVVTDLSCNPLTSFTCNGGGTANTGITYIEGATPQEIWVTDFASNSTTRCAVPILGLTKTVGVGSTCTGSAIEVYPGTDVTYCYEVENLGNAAYTTPVTYTNHTLVDDQLGTILANVAVPLGPGDTYLVTQTAFLTQSVTNNATWDATNTVVTDTATASAYVGVLNSPPSLCTTYNSTNVPVTIGPDPSVVTSDLTVPDTFTLFDVNVALNATHTWDADLNFSLLRGATTIDLSSGNGGSGDNYLSTIFDDQGATPITAGVPPYTGRFSPESPLSVLNGQPSNGTWTLRIEDTAFADGGTLTAWSVELCESPVGAVTLSHTVGTTPAVCATTSEITVTTGTDVYYCYTISNTGNITLTHHDLADSYLGTLFTDFRYDLGPGDSVSTVDAGVVATANITQTTVSNSTWDADLPGLASGQATSTATVNVAVVTAVTLATLDSAGALPPQGWGLLLAVGAVGALGLRQWLRRRR